MQITKSSIAAMYLTVALSLSTGLLAQDLPDDPGELEDHSSFLKLRPGYQDCLDKAAGVVPAMIRCNDAEYSYQDKRLNAAYKKLVKKAGADARKALVDEERGWIASKERDCAIPSGAGQGDILDATGCSVTYTARRATVLERRFGD
ncbi:uncharacterized protein YecT (DUF1311 family) [Luteibacter sp. 621]|uniref:lysozyme inhibitor LprI family protein n=1 Tax=Luteibacter sp. 621 TaxID=3373916 RepID=UPI003D21A5FD